MRGSVGSTAERRLRMLLVERLSELDLLVDPKLTPDQVLDAHALPRNFLLKSDVAMRFGSDPDVSFSRKDQLIAVLEIKGGIDPAGALERYGAAKKTFEHALEIAPRCETFFLTAVETKEVARRLEADRLVRHVFNIIKLADDPKYRETFFDELFNHALRLR